MNFLVTGGAGFIGSHLCERLLHAGHSVWALDDLNGLYDPALKEQNLAEIRALGRPFTFVRADLLDPHALQQLFAQARFDQVIHLAARTGVRASLREPALYQRVNVEGTANVLEAARAQRVKKITIASSASVYGVNAKLPFAEDDHLQGIVSPYAASKLAGEALGHVYHRVYGADVVVLRLFGCYGPRQPPDLAIHKFARLISQDRPVPMFGDGTSARDYTYITDIINGIMAVTQKEFGFRIFNLGGSQTVPLRYVIDLLEKALGKKAALERHPPQPGDAPITYANIGKARSLLGYSPSVKIEQGLPIFVEWLRTRPK